MKCVQGSFRAERDLIIDFFKPQTLNRVLPAHDPLHDIGNRFADVVICNFAFDNIIIVRIVCPAAAGNDKLQPIHACAVEPQKAELLCGILVPFIDCLLYTSDAADE